MSESRLKQRLEEQIKAYRLVLGVKTHAHATVLEDLAQFCKWGETPFHPSERETCVMIGRQQVFTRIARFLNLPDDQLFDYAHGNMTGNRLRAIIPREESN